MSPIPAHRLDESAYHRVEQNGEQAKPCMTKLLMANVLTDNREPCYIPCGFTLPGSIQYYDNGCYGDLRLVGTMVYGTICFSRLNHDLKPDDNNSSADNTVTMSPP